MGQPEAYGSSCRDLQLLAGHILSCGIKNLHRCIPQFSSGGDEQLSVRYSRGQEDLVFGYFAATTTSGSELAGEYSAAIGRCIYCIIPFSKVEICNLYIIHSVIGLFPAW